MHELGIAEEILQAVLKELTPHSYSRVNRIELLIGTSNLLTEESLQNAFDLVCENTKAKGALLKVEQVPGMKIEIRHIEAE